MVTVRFFASLKDLAGTSEVEVQITGKTDVEAVFEKLKLSHPQLKAYPPPLMVAVNEEYAHWNTPVSPGDEIAFFPPVSGGSR
jgi:molybdopterin synthase sulfur carrier subunit